MCFDFAKHGRPKVPIRKLSPSGSIKTEVHAPGFYEFASKFYYKRARSARKRHADGVPFRAPLGRFPLPYFGKAETGRAGAPQCAASNSPRKSGRVPDFLTSARAVPQGTFSCPFGAIHLVAARPRPPCGREGGIVFGFSGTENVSRGDSVPPGIRVSE